MEVQNQWSDMANLTRKIPNESMAMTPRRIEQLQKHV